MTRAYTATRTAHGVDLRARASARTRDINLSGRRAEWRELVDKARAASLFSIAPDDAAFVRDLAHLVARASKAPPPLEGECDRQAAEAFRLLALVWTRKATPPSAPPAELGAALGSAARLIDQLLTEEQMRAAEVWQRQSGGRD